MNPICTFRAPEEMRKRLKAAAKKKGITMNAMILQILWAWLMEKGDNEHE